MFRSRFSESTRTLIYSATVVALAAVALIFSAAYNQADAVAVSSPIAAAPSATFAANAGSLGAIPDSPGPTTCGTNSGANRDVTFTVSGLSGSVSTVEVNNLTFGSPIHTWRGDITARLIAPNGANFLLFGWTGSTTTAGCGSANDLTGPYTFADTATLNWWTTLTNPTPAGSYRTSTQGGVAGGGAQTLMNPAFTGVTNANGTWTLRINDWGVGDTGGVTAATLTVNTAAPPLSGDANVDMNGDGKSDFVIVRGTTTPLGVADSPAQSLVNRGATSIRDRLKLDRETPAELTPTAPPIYWYVLPNPTGPGTHYVAPWGDAATDFLVPEDFDGDDKDDFAVWRPGSPATLYVLQSTTNTARIESFGQTGDDPAIMGDYDGDDKADPAVYRCPIFPATGQCTFYFRGSNANPSGNITYVPWGNGSDVDFFVNPGDFDGDGKYDFCIQRSNPSAPTQGQFVLLKSSNLGAEYINWGLSSDIILPGDYDGDGSADFCVRRTNASNQREHFILERDGGGTGASPIIWGIAGDTSTPGDYDGDAKQDIAIWRPNSADPTANFFWVRKSSDGGLMQIEWGQCPTGNCDYAVANWYVH